MDDSADIRRGGAVEPASRSAASKVVARTLDEQMRTRFELHDPFAEVTYRTKTFDEMVLKADQLGAVRFNAIDEQGHRTPVIKVDGAWQRPPAEAIKQPIPAREPSARAAATSAQTPLIRIDTDAERDARVARLQIALHERYVIKRAVVAIGDKPIGQNEYRFRGDTSRVAFTESAFKLSTDTNSPSVARSMVDVAESRQWHSLRISGHEEFRRMVWLEASARGLKTIGYEPVPGDHELLRKERELRQVNRIETAEAQGSTTKGSARGSGGRKTVLAALEAVLVAQRVPEKRREAILTAAAENLAKRLAAGEVHKVRVYDKAAPQQQLVMRPAPEQQRARERTAHVR